MNKLFFIFLCVCFINFDKVIGSNFDWTSFGANNYGTRNADDIGRGSPLSSSTVSRLGITKYFLTNVTGGQDGWVSTTPYVDANVVIFPSRDQYVYCLRRKDFSVRWKVYLPDVSGGVDDFSTTTPTLWDGVVFIGHQHQAYISKLDYYTGKVAWAYSMHSHPYAAIEGSVTVQDNALYFGISSNEQAMALVVPMYSCCSFVGQFIKASAVTGEILNTFRLIDSSVPLGPGQYSGVPVLGSQPLIYLRGNSVIFGTGSTYTVPTYVTTCQGLNPNSTTCVDPDVYYNGIVSLDLDTFELNWYYRHTNIDAWFATCATSDICPPLPGTDAEFGENGALIDGVVVNGVKQDVLVIGQKSGVVWCHNAMTGDLNWGRSIGPSGTLPNAVWGLATDGQSVYAANINNENNCHYINSPIYTKTFGGSWSRVAVGNGNLVWTAADPNTQGRGEDYPVDRVDGALAVGAVSIVNDIVIGTSTAYTGSIVIIDKLSGLILRVIDTGSTIYGGVAIYDNCFYLGNGYDRTVNDFFTKGHKLFELCVPHKIK